MTPTKHGNVLSWASDLDPKALDQAERSASLPFIAGHVALMPDAHWGLGATVGSVIPTQGAIIPAAVGVDIGCGMIAAEMPFLVDALPDDLDRYLGFVEQAIPAGVGKGHQSTRYRTIPDPTGLDLTDKQVRTARNQMGSLGSGNHFFEVCTDERDRVWLVLHSGSRGIGNQLAKVHIEGARGLMERYFIDLPDPDLAYLVEGTPEFDTYIRAMLWAQDYALANRDAMMDAALVQLAAFTGQEIVPTRRINCHHNFTEKEHHHSRNVWLTRKGAIRAREGDEGVIPGSMGAASYIVAGLGNHASYDSCSHGAGRRMSRGKARKTLDVETFTAEMQGRTWQAAQAEALLDEDPRAYKDIDQVMADQQDLVRVEHRLTQILNYKGL